MGVSDEKRSFSELWFEVMVCDVATQTDLRRLKPRVLQFMVYEIDQTNRRAGNRPTLGESFWRDRSEALKVEDLIGFSVEEFLDALKTLEVIVPAFWPAWLPPSEEA
jgi:hypothetical protein